MGCYWKQGWAEGKLGSNTSALRFQCSHKGCRAEIGLLGRPGSRQRDWAFAPLTVPSHSHRCPTGSLW